MHTVTATDRSFLSRELLKSPNFVTGTMLMFLIGGILSGTLALIPTMLQHLMHYPVMTTGLIPAARAAATAGCADARSGSVRPTSPTSVR